MSVHFRASTCVDITRTARVAHEPPGRSIGFVAVIRSRCEAKEMPHSFAERTRIVATTMMMVVTMVPVATVARLLYVHIPKRNSRASTKAEVKRKMWLLGKVTIARGERTTYHNNWRGWRDCDCRCTVVSAVPSTTTVGRHVCHRLAIVIIAGGMAVSAVPMTPMRACRIDDWLSVSRSL